jgi:hypothetical protein
MSADQIFQICNSIAPIGWILLVFLPQWKWTQRIVVAGILPLLLGIVYLSIILLHFGDSGGDFNSLNGVMQLFTSKWGVTAGWIHYLAFDLFIGSWELSNGQKNGIHHLVLVPSLLLTFLFGPIGLIVYFVTRFVKTKKILHENF